MYGHKRYFYSDKGLDISNIGCLFKPKPVADDYLMFYSLHQLHTSSQNITGKR